MPARKCKGTNKQTGERCRAWAMQGQLVCWTHGGAAPQNRAAGQRRLQEEKATSLLLDSLKDIPRMESIGDVYDELLEVAAVASAWRKILQQRVSELQALGYQGITAEQVKADVQLFERALDRSAKVGESIARLNLDERKAALDERTAGVVAQCITRVLDSLEIAPEQRQRATAVMVSTLRELSA